MLNKKVKTTNMEMTEAISAYVHSRVDALERFIDPNVQALAEIEIGKTTQHHHKGDVFKAEMNLSVGKDRFRAVLIESDLYVAIDKMKDVMLLEITRAKRKKDHLFRRGGQKIKDLLRGLLPTRKKEF